MFCWLHVIWSKTFWPTDIFSTHRAYLKRNFLRSTKWQVLAMSAKCLLAKCLSAKCLLAKCLSAKCLLAKCLSVKCLLAKCLSAKWLLMKWFSAKRGGAILLEFVALGLPLSE